MFSRNELTLGTERRVSVANAVMPPPIAESVVVFENCRHTVYGLVSAVNILIHKVYKHILKLNDAEGDRTSVFLVFLFVGCFIEDFECEGHSVHGGSSIMLQSFPRPEECKNVHGKFLCGRKNLRRNVTCQL